MEAERFVINSVCGNNPINKGFFVPLDEKTHCHHCKDFFYIMHPTTQGRFWCPQCYIKNYCNIERSGSDFIIIQKKSSKILYQYSPITENVETSTRNTEIHN